MFNYADAIDYVYGLNKNRFIRLNFGFSRMEAVLARLGNPERKLKAIHVAGTKGKGSTISFLSFILGRRYKTGLFTSPSLNNVLERISVNGILMSPKEFVCYTKRLKKIYRSLSEEFRPTTFETFTIIAFLYFLDKQLDLSLLEVGMGGRLDATNIITSPLVSVITPISFDHQKVLGNTLFEIAGEKAGIIKKNTPVVIGKQPVEAREKIVSVAKANHSQYFLYGKDFYVENISENSSGTVFDFYSPYFNVKLKGAKISLIGAHQAENAAVSVQTALLLNELGINISIEEIITGLEKTFWPGRFEIVYKKPFIVLDGAHNGASARALSNALNYFKKGKIVYLFGILKDKNIDDVLSQIATKDAVFVLTEVPFSGRRRMQVESTADVLKKYLPKTRIFTEKNFRRAYFFARNLVGKNDILCVTGSLYLVASVRKIMNRFVFSGNIL